jgi:hypothetical protein
MTNNTAAPITELTIGYTGEQWRQSQGVLGSSGVEKLRLFYSTSPSTGWVSVGLDWTAPKQGPANAALDGNLAANRNVLTPVAFTPAIAIAPASTFYLRWQDWNENGTTDHGLAIDDVSVTITPEPTSFGLLAVGGLALLNRRRRA